MTSKTPKPWARLYGTERWRRRSRLNLRMHPMCAKCLREGRWWQEANLSHHINEYREGFSTHEFWFGDLESLCFACHAELHGYNAPRKFDTAIGSDGFPEDHKHPFWQQEQK